MTAREASLAGLLLLLLACAHEFVWQDWPAGVQGDVRNITQQGPVWLLCWVFARLAARRFVTAVCAAVAVMSTTTAACSLAWLINPWPVMPGADQCTRRWGVPMLLLSGFAALLALTLWRPPNGPESR